MNGELTDFDEQRWLVLSAAHQGVNRWCYSYTWLKTK